ncbi:MAG TPA: PD-(D/E)XK nuclease family protein, partial [Clostridia bacterium]|nr:PD-(D/E)XK nuclease family protein [Clostridia bacterium]
EEELAQAEQVCGASLGLYANELVQLARMNLLDTLAAPTERLWVSHAFTGCSGEVRRPASVFIALERMFPNAARVGGIEPGTLHGVPAVLFAPGPMLDALGPLLREAMSGIPLSPEWRESLAALLADDEWGVRCRRLLNGLRPDEELSPLDPRTTKALYARASQSVTRLETFASCPYRHFVRYGLRPQENRAYGVERDEAGTFYHQVMEAYVREALLLSDRWPAHWTREESDALCDRIMQPFLQAWEAGPLGENAVQRLVGRRYARVARRAAWTFSRQMQACAFWPAEMELRFGMGGPLPPFFLELPDGQRLALEGRIDRIDLWEDEERLYLRILDYKSGQTEVQPTKVYYGLQLQLLLYLAVSLRAFPQACPAGAFYFHVDEPIVNEPSRLKEAVEDRLMKTLRLKGIVLSELKVVKAMDTGEQPLSLPEIFKRDGEPRANASAVSETEMTALLHHAQEVGVRLATRINAGHLERRPAEIQNWSACEWCEYRTICLRDPRQAGRRLEKMDHREMVARILKEQSKDRPSDD